MKFEKMTNKPTISDDVDWISADDDCFAEAVSSLMKDNGKRKLIGINRNRFITENFTWAVDREKLSMLL